MFHTISTRDLQRTPKKVLDEAKKLNKPLIIIADNKPAGAIVSIEFLKKMESTLTLQALETEADEEYKKGNVEILDSYDKLIGHFNEIDNATYVQDKNRTHATVQKRTRKVRAK